MANVIRFGALTAATCVIALASAACDGSAVQSSEQPPDVDVEGLQFSSGLVLDVFVPDGWRMKSALSGYEDEDGTGISNSQQGDEFYLMRETREVGALLDSITEDPAEQPWHELDRLVDADGGYSIWISPPRPCGQIDAQRIDLEDTIRREVVGDPLWAESTGTSYIEPLVVPDGVGEEGMLLTGIDGGPLKSVYLSRLPIGNGDCHLFRAEGGTREYDHTLLSAQLTEIVENSSIS